MLTLNTRNSRLLVAHNPRFVGTTQTPRWAHHKIPVDQHLIWAGPLLLNYQRNYHTHQRRIDNLREKGL